MKIETFARSARARGHTVQIDRKNRYASVTHNVSDGYRIDVYVNFDDDRNIVSSYEHKIFRYDERNAGGHYAGAMALIALPDLVNGWQAWNKKADSA